MLYDKFTLHNVCAVHRGCAVQWGLFSTPGRYHEYTGGYHEYTGGYHEKYGGRSLGKQLNLSGNPSVLNILWCTHDIPHTHHGIFQCTHGIPQCTPPPHTSWYSPSVLMISSSALNTPWCTHDIPSVLNTPPPSEYNYIPQCTEHPPVYCTDIMQGEVEAPYKARGSNFVDEIFVFTLGHCINSKAIRYESTSFNRIVANKLQSVTLPSVNTPSFIPFCFAGGPQLSKAAETKVFCSGFGVKKFRKFPTFIYCFTSHKQHITIGQEFYCSFNHLSFIVYRKTWNG